MHGRHGEVIAPHLLRQPIHLPFRVAENHGLRDCQCIIQVTESVEFPLLALHSYKKLLDALANTKLPKSLRMKQRLTKHFLIGQL